jgi:hypothetical protein
VFTSEQAAVAVAVIQEVAGYPDSGIVKELIDEIKKSVDPAKVVRVVTAKEIR